MITNVWSDRKAVKERRQLESENVRDAICKALAQRQAGTSLESVRAIPSHDSIIDHVNHAFPDRSLMKHLPQLVAAGSTIKQLIMVPFDKRPLDMLAHRVGNTIYLDHVVLPKNRRASEKQSQSFSTPSTSSNRNDELAQAFVASWVSNTDDGVEETWKGLTESQEDIWDLSNAVSVMNFNTSSSSGTGQIKETWPRPRSLSYQITTEGENSSMHLWEFSNLRLLVDHEIPMLSGENLPSISIRFDEDKPISILTGMDIWLDHMIKGLDGVVVVHQGKGRQKDFKVHLTSEIPQLTGSEFDPGELATVIENVYKFLDDKMTEQGHTYYLHRAEGSGDLTLYDMTAMFPDLSSNIECNPSLPVVACALMKQAQDLLNDDDPPSTTAVEIAYKMIQSAQTIIHEDHLPHVAASLSYLRAALYQCIPLNLTKEKLALTMKKSNNLFGLESILIERTPQMSSSVPVDALRQAVSIVDDDESKDSAAIRLLEFSCTVPGIDSGHECIRNALTAIDQGLKHILVVEERRKRSKEAKFARIPIFAIGKDDENTAQKERKKSRLGTDVELLKSLLHLRAIVGYHSAALIHFGSETDPKILMAECSSTQLTQNAFLFELCRVAFSNCAEVMRLDSSSRTRIAATVQAAALFRVYLLVILNLSRLSAAELSDKLAEVRSNDIFLKKQICKVVMPDSNVLKVLVEIGEESITDAKALDTWLLNVGNKFRTLLTKYTKEYEQLETRMYREHFDLTAIRSAIALAMLQGGERHREAGLKEENKMAVMEHFRSAIHFYEIGSKHLDVVIQEDSQKVDTTAWHLQIALHHNEAAIHRGLVILEMETSKHGKKIDQSIREVLFSYLTLENLIDKQNSEDFPTKTQQKAAVINDTISFLHRCYFFHAGRPGVRNVLYRTSRESYYLDESFVGAKRLWNLSSTGDEKTMISQIKVRNATAIAEMLLHSIYFLFMTMISEGFVEEEAELLGERVTKIVIFSMKSTSANLPLTLSESCLAYLRDILDTCKTIKIDQMNLGSMVAILNVTIKLIVLLSNCSTNDDMKTGVQVLFNDACGILQGQLLTILASKTISSKSLMSPENTKRLKQIADLVIRRQSSDSTDWASAAQVWTKTMLDVWQTFDSIL